MTVHLLIQGKVQGVFYRVSAQKMAVKMGITGWVKNTPDKHVEILASGPDEQLQKFLDWCRQGPSGARVEKFITGVVEDRQFEEFKILH